MRTRLTISPFCDFCPKVECLGVVSGSENRPRHNQANGNAPCHLVLPVCFCIQSNLFWKYTLDFFHPFWFELFGCSNAILYSFGLVIIVATAFCKSIFDR